MPDSHPIGGSHHSGIHEHEHPGHSFTGSICAICSREAKHTCPLCQSTVCTIHFKSRENCCAMCAARKAREDMRNREI